MNYREQIKNYIEYFKIKDNLSLENELRYINDKKKYYNVLKKIILYLFLFIVILSIYALCFPYLNFIIELESAIRNELLSNHGDLIFKSSIVFVIAVLVPVFSTAILIFICFISPFPFSILFKYTNRFHYNFVPENRYQRKRYWNITFKYYGKSINLFRIWQIIAIFGWIIYCVKQVVTEGGINIYFSAKIGAALVICSFLIMYFINTLFRVKYFYSIKRLKILIIRNTIMDVLTFIIFLLFLAFLANISIPLIIKSVNYIPSKAIIYITKLDKDIIEEYTKLTINENYKNKFIVKYKDGIFKDYKKKLDWDFNFTKYNQNKSIVTNYIPLLILLSLIYTTIIPLIIVFFKEKNDYY